MFQPLNIIKSSLNKFLSLPGTINVLVAFGVLTLEQLIKYLKQHRYHTYKSSVSENPFLKY